MRRGNGTHLGDLVDASSRHSPFTSLLGFNGGLLHQAAGVKSEKIVGI